MTKGKFLTLTLLVIAALAISGCANRWKTSGKIALGSKNYDKAIDDFHKALEQTPNDGEVYYLLALTYKEKNDYASMPENLNMADSLYEKGKDKIRDLRESTFKELFESGNSETKSENYEKAKDQFETAIAILPDNYAAYINAGFVWQHLGDNDSAFYYFEKAYKLEPENIKVLENYASLLFNLERYDEADSIYMKILEKDPKHVEAIVRRAMIANNKKDFETSAALYDKALELEPENCDLWFNLGVMKFRELKDNDSALSCFTRAVELCPEDVNAQINLCVVLISMKKFDEAVTRLETFTQDFPKECVGWDLYSQALLQLGNRSKALEADNKYKECTGEGN